MIVIGLGPGGVSLTAMGTKLGLNVLAIEKGNVGGECLNCGCIPSKGILKAANVKYMACHCEKYGFKHVPGPKVEKPFDRISNYVDYVVKNLAEPKITEATQIHSKGFAKIIDKNTVEVDGTRYSGKRIYIATGTEPLVPPIPGLDTVEYLTNQNIFKLKDVPKSMFIIGAGAIGCEMAQAFSRLGCSVSVAHNGTHVLPLCDPESASVLESEFLKEGITVYNETNILNVERVGNKIKINTDHGSHLADKLLVATGRRANIENLNLDAVGVKYNRRGIIVDENCRTNIKSIYAVGDCNGRSLFSHAAMHQGMLALANGFPLVSMKMKNYQLPWSVFTDPEVAQVGMTETQLTEKGIKFEVYKSYYKDYARAITDEATDGFVKVLASKYGRVYGATIVGEAASELIHEWVFIIQNKINLFKVLFTMHSFPTISVLNKRIAEDWAMKWMENKTVRKIGQFLFRL